MNGADEKNFDDQSEDQFENSDSSSEDINGGLTDPQDKNKFN